MLYAIFSFCFECCAFTEITQQPSDERSAGGSGEGEPYLCGSPDRPFLLYRQRHVFFSAGRKENVGLKQWVLEIVTLWLAETNSRPTAWYFPPTESTQRSLRRCDATQTPVASATQGVPTPWALGQTPGGARDGYPSATPASYISEPNSMHCHTASSRKTFRAFRRLPPPTGSWQLRRLLPVAPVPASAVYPTLFSDILPQ